MSPAFVQHFFLALSASTSPTVTGQRVRQDACSRLRRGAGGLLRHDTRWRTGVCDRQAAACLVSGTHNYADLHWLDVVDRVRYKLAVTVPRCLHNKAAKYLADCCVAVSDIVGRKRSTLGHRAFPVA